MVAKRQMQNNLHEEPDHDPSSSSSSSQTVSPSPAQLLQNIKAHLCHIKAERQGGGGGGGWRVCFPKEEEAAQVSDGSLKRECFCSTTGIERMCFGCKLVCFMLVEVVVDDDGRSLSADLRREGAGGGGWAEGICQPNEKMKI